MKGSTTRAISFGDNVVVRSTPETVASGFAALSTVSFALLACSACDGTPVSSDPISNSDNCTVPSTDTYVCDAAVSGEGACGALNEEGSDAGLDASFSVGCEVRRPYPSGFYRGTASCPHPAATCSCGLYGDSGPGWLCGD